MATSNVLQTPSIIEIVGSTIRVAHPDISGNLKTYLSAPIAAAGLTMNVLDSFGWRDDDWFIIGSPGDEKTEENDINEANPVSNDGVLTVTNGLTYGHEIDAPVTRIWERGVKIYGAATNGGAGTLLASVDAFTASGQQLADAVMIQWNKPYTEWTLISTDTEYAFYYAVFTDGTTDSSSSDYIPAAGHAVTSVQTMINEALDMTGAEINERISLQFLIRSADACQNRITQYVNKKTNIKKDWTFEMIEDTTSLDAATLENTYALSSLTNEMKYVDTKQSILNIRVGSEIIDYQTIEEHDAGMQGINQTFSNGGAAIGATTMVVDDISEFSTSGTLHVGANVITYTGVTDATNTFTGIPASGTGSITATISDDDTVWQGITGGLPSRYTIFDGNIIFSRPFSSTYNGYAIKVRYLRRLTRLQTPSDTTQVTFSHIFPYFIAHRIEIRRGNFDKAKEFERIFNEELQEQAQIDKAYVLEVYRYKNLSDGNLVSEAMFDDYPNTTAGLNNPQT